MTRDRAALSREEHAVLTHAQSATYLGVSERYFEDEIRPYLPVYDLARPGAKKAMPRWSRVDLDAFLAARRVEKKAS